MSLASNIASIIQSQNRKWSIGGKKETVTTERVLNVLNSFYDHLKESEDLTQASTGGILMVKDSGHYDVYLHLGEYNGHTD